jgi:hypothetical protein
MKSRRHHHKPYAGGMLSAYFLVATMAAYFPVATMAATYNTTIPT